MAQNGRVVGGQNNANTQALPTASLFRFYVWNDRGNDPQHLHVLVRLDCKFISKPLLKIRVIGLDPATEA